VGSLAGRITDLAGAAIPGAQLTLSGTAGEVARIRSGGEGEFRFSDLASGAYSVKVTARGLVSMTLEGIRVEGPTTIAIAMTVAVRGGIVIWALGDPKTRAAQEVGSLAGTVVDRSGAAIPGVQLTLRGINGEVARIFSGGKGEFRFPKLLPGTYSIEASAPGLIYNAAKDFRVASGAEATAKIVMEVFARYADCGPGPRTRFDSIEPALAEFAGVVEGPVPIPPAGARSWVNRPVENVLITAIRPMLLTETGSKSGGVAASTRTDKEGRFKLVIPEPSRYTVTAHKDGYADFIVEDIVTGKGLRTTILWTLPLGPCPTAGQCEPDRNFPPLICM